MLDVANMMLIVKCVNQFLTVQNTPLKKTDLYGNYFMINTLKGYGGKLKHMSLRRESQSFERVMRVHGNDADIFLYPGEDMQFT